MADVPTVIVSVEDGVHKCTPSPMIVKANDVFAWDGDLQILVFFPKESPLLEGRGPFTNGQRVTVRSIPPLKSKEQFEVVIAIRGVLRETKGDIIVV